ncbi:MAG: hypothetical protein JWQ97_3742, partial [Phenylobacterium sp.]|nr:hypothetical protein [Phenylobacterium sp.]
MARAARAQGSGLAPGLRRAVLTALVLYVLVSAVVLWRAAVLTPYSDELDWVARWYALQQSHDWAA